MQIHYLTQVRDTRVQAMDFSPIWFSCSFCRRSFPQKSKLIAHQKQLHAHQIQMRKKKISQQDENSSNDSSEKLHLGKVTQINLEQNGEISMQNEETAAGTRVTDSSTTELICLSGDSEFEVEETLKLEEIELSCKNCSKSFQSLHQLTRHGPECRVEEAEALKNIGLKLNSAVKEADIDIEKMNPIDPTQSQESDVMNPSTKMDPFQEGIFLKQVQFLKTRKMGAMSVGNNSPLFLQKKKLKLYKCCLCSKSYTWNQSLIFHQRKFHPPKQQLPTSSQFQNTNEQDIDVIFNDPPMSPKIQPETKFKQDQEKIGDIDFTALFCDICGKHFSTLDRLGEHVPVCEFNRNVILRAQMHQTQHQNLETEPFIPQLTANFPLMSLYDPHGFLTEQSSQWPRRFSERPTESSHLESESRVNAETSELRFSFKVNSISSEIDHLNMFKCTTCHKYFKHRKYLARHQKIHTPKPALILEGPGNEMVNRENFSCLVCGRIFSRKCSLVLHSQVHGEFGCGSCDLTFKHSAHFEEHMAQYHPQPMQGS